jgi:hypothetical protein
VGVSGSCVGTSTLALQSELTGRDGTPTRDRVIVCIDFVALGEDHHVARLGERLGVWMHPSSRKASHPSPSAFGLLHDDHACRSVESVGAGASQSSLECLMCRQRSCAKHPQKHAVEEACSSILESLAVL